MRVSAIRLVSRYEYGRKSLCLAVVGVTVGTRTPDSIFTSTAPEGTMDVQR